MSNAGKAEGLSPADRLKQAAGEAAAALVEDGMVVGLGTGSTAAFAVAALGRRVAEGLRIVGIPTSERTAAQARELSHSAVRLCAAYVDRPDHRWGR